MAYLHSHRGPGCTNGVVHRDLKPSNVRIDQSGVAVLIDYGVARPHDVSDMTQGVGTYRWRAPEVVGGPGVPGPASDIWGLGALAYWVLLGGPPMLEGVPVARERLVPAAAAAGLVNPEALGVDIVALLATDPADRPVDVAGWGAPLEHLLSTPLRARRRLQRMLVGLAGDRRPRRGCGRTVGAEACGRPWTGRGHDEDDVEIWGCRPWVTVTSDGRHGIDRRRPPRRPRQRASAMAATAAGSERRPRRRSSRVGGLANSTGGDSATTSPTTTAVVATTTTGSSARSGTWNETVGGNANTWTNYTNAGGAQGQTIPAFTTVQIACAVQGFRVADGNTWWYRIAQAPWSGTFYVSADAFYNNGSTSGSLIGTPFVDPSVAKC